jgi:hypothetical protein
MSEQPRGSEEPGDQILNRPARDTPADASSSGLGRALDQEADVAGGRWAIPDAATPDATSEPESGPADADAGGSDGP